MCLIVINQVINWKLACVPLLKPIQGHSEPRVFKFERRDPSDEKSPVVMKVKLHMAAIAKEGYIPDEGWEIWKTVDRPTVADMTFLPKKKIDVVGLRRTLAYMKKKKYIKRSEYEQVSAFIVSKEVQNNNTCGICMDFRAQQLTHKSSKAHTDDERLAHRRVRDQVAKSFDKHLFDDRKTHAMPRKADCWPIGNEAVINRVVDAKIVDDTDSDTDSEKLAEDELFADYIGKEVMSVGRVQYPHLKPLKLGNMVVLYASDSKDKEEFYVGKAFAWQKNGGNKKLVIHWYGHKKNANLEPKDRKYFAGERFKDSKEQEFWIDPKHKVKKDQEWIESVPHDSLVYWSETSFLNITGIINHYKLPRILARVQYVKANINSV